MLAGLFCVYHAFSLDGEVLDGLRKITHTRGMGKSRVLLRGMPIALQCSVRTIHPQKTREGFMSEGVGKVNAAAGEHENHPTVGRGYFEPLCLQEEPL